MDLGMNMGLGVTGRLTRGGSAQGDGSFALVFHVTLAKLAAAGGSTQTAIMDTGLVLPAGALPISMTARNLGDTMESSGGTITNFALRITDEAGVLRAGTPFSMQVANQRGVGPLTPSTGVDGRFDYYQPCPIYATALLSGEGTHMSNLTGFAAGAEVRLVYMIP